MAHVSNFLLTFMISCRRVQVVSVYFDNKKLNHVEFEKQPYYLSLFRVSGILKALFHFRIKFALF